MSRNAVLIGIAALALFAALGGFGVAYWKRSPNATRYLPALHIAEDAYGIPRDLLARIAYEESRFRNDIITGIVKSATGAVGIMQIMPKYHPGVNALDPYIAINYAGSFLRKLYDQFKDWKLAVAAYNAGAANVTKYHGVPPFEETQKYVAEIFADVPLRGGNS